MWVCTVSFSHLSLKSIGWIIDTRTKITGCTYCLSCKYHVFQFLVTYSCRCIVCCVYNNNCLHSCCYCPSSGQSTCFSTRVERHKYKLIHCQHYQSGFLSNLLHFLQTTVFSYLNAYFSNLYESPPATYGSFTLYFARMSGPGLALRPANGSLGQWPGNTGLGLTILGKAKADTKEPQCLSAFVS